MGIIKIIPEGSRFGKLVVLGIEDGWIRRVRYACRCDCGAMHSVDGRFLTAGSTKSCGCWKSDSKPLLRKRGVIENGKQTPEYRSYYGMKKRCFDEKNQDFHSYGGRGIEIADEWLGDGGFQRFLDHVGKRPSPRHSIDRIDVNGNYAPGNVRWSTPKAQSQNKRTSWSIFVDGVWVNAKRAAPMLGIPYSSLVNACRGAQGFPRGFVVPIFRRGGIS